MSVSKTDKLLREDGMATWFREQTMRRSLEHERKQQSEQSRRKLKEHDMGR